MAFINENNGTTNNSSANDPELKEILECSKTTCQFNIEGNKCSLEYCFYDNTEWKLSKETFEFECQVCNEKTTGDSRNAHMRICPHCLERIKEMGTVRRCKLCTSIIDPKKISLWGTGICDLCATKLKAVLTIETRTCTLCGKSHRATAFPLTNICPECTSILKRIVKNYYN